MTVVATDDDTTSPENDVTYSIPGTLHIHPGPLGISYYYGERICP